MEQVEVMVALLACAGVLAVAARRTPVPYPVVLVCGGLAIALVPGLPTVELDPDLVFVLLPPLLFFPAITTSLRDFRANVRAIGLLAIGLVLTTTLVVGAYRQRRFDALVADGDGGSGSGGEDGNEIERRTGDYRRLMTELLVAQRRVAVELRDTGAIGDGVLLAVQRDLDLEQARIDSGLA